MGERLCNGETSVPYSEVAKCGASPARRPRDIMSHAIGRLQAIAQRVHYRVLPALMVLQYLIDPQTQRVEDRAMSGKDEMDLEARQLFERRDIVAKGVISRVRIDTDVGAGVIEDVIAGDNELPVSFEKADMAGRMPGREYHLELEGVVRNRITVLQVHVRRLCGNIFLHPE